MAISMVQNNLRMRISLLKDKVELDLTLDKTTGLPLLSEQQKILELVSNYQPRLKDGG